VGDPNVQSSSADASSTTRGKWSIPARSVELTQAVEVEGALVQTLGDGTEIEFTVEPALQQKALDILRYYRVEYGTVVAMNPKTGDILAMAEHAEGRPDLRRLALQAEGPAASIFKIVTGAVLVEEAGLSAETEICTHGGRRGLTSKLLQPNARRDRTCQTMAQALGASNNVAFGRWADQKLSPKQLESWAERFLFNRRLPFVYGVAMSRARIPTGSQLGLAKTAAGFQGTNLSPLHAALIASSVANEGTMMVPRLIRSARQNGEVVYERRHQELAKVMEASTARELRKMMLETTKVGGSAGRFFHRKRRGRVKARIPGLSVAGKTGSLSARGAGVTRYYSWFVAFAPAEDPEIALAALVVNGEVWTVKGAAVAAQLLEHWNAELRKK
jgi:cell division protein FtsI/penicillin-binding protein 2